jgi:integrase
MNTVGALKDNEQIKMFNEGLLNRTRSLVYSEIFVIGLQFALRIDDLLSLTFEDVLGKDKFYIQESKGKRFKNKKKRMIAINDTAKSVILSRRLRYPDHEYLFQNEDSGIPFTQSAVQKVFKRVSDQLDLGVAINTHSLRKTKGHQLWKSGVKVEIISKFLGHSDVSSTMRYLGIDEGDLEECFMQDLYIGG